MICSQCSLVSHTTVWSRSSTTGCVWVRLSCPLDVACSEPEIQSNPCLKTGYRFVWLNRNIAREMPLGSGVVVCACVSLTHHHTDCSGHSGPHALSLHGARPAVYMHACIRAGVRLRDKLDRGTLYTVWQCETISSRVSPPLPSYARRRKEWLAGVTCAKLSVELLYSTHELSLRNVLPPS